ncbi:MAG: CBS domain-containing protein [Deltaproteobacteria bacterium]|nr:CBS domain-containing protein [Deltaproteobacteria bacterium]
MKVRDVMQRKVVTLGERDSAFEALRTLVRRGVSGAPVVRDGRVVGLVTEFDLLLALDFIGDGVEVAKVMKTEVVGVRPDTSLVEVRSLFMTHRFRRVPVVSRGRLVGIVSRRDLLRAELESSRHAPARSGTRRGRSR